MQFSVINKTPLLWSYPSAGDSVSVFKAPLTGLPCFGERYSKEQSKPGSKDSNPKAAPPH